MSVEEAAAATGSRAPTASARQPIVPRNDWRVLDVPAVGSWTPTLTTSVVIPAYGSQDRLNLTLAALSCQTYPAHLLEVVVADDGSSPPLELPPIRPENTRVVRVTTGWGRAAACHTGALAAEGDVIHWLDSDMVAFREHVEAQLRWQHAISYAVTLGYKRFVPDDLWPVLTPERVAADCARGAIADAFPPDAVERHEWIEQIIDATQGLAEAGPREFRVHVGATATVRRELYLDAGGMDISLHLGEDTELGYRLAQQGAVFIPEPEARSWHLGASTVMRSADRVKEFNRPYFAQRVPLFPQHRVPSRSWAVPLVEVLIDATEAPYEWAAATVDRVLANDLQDLRVVLVAPWSKVDDGRVALLADEAFGLRFLREYYSAEPRVRLLEAAPPSSFPAAFRCELPVTTAVDQDSMRLLHHQMAIRNLGLLQAVVAAGVDERPGVVRMVRTAALHRALRVGDGLVGVDDVIDEVHGSWWVDGAEYGLRPHDTGSLTDPLVPRYQSNTTEVRRLRRQLARTQADLDELRRRQERLRRSLPGRLAMVVVRLRRRVLRAGRRLRRNDRLLTR